MKKWILFSLLNFMVGFVCCQDWEGIAVPPNPGAGKVWQLQQNVSDDFNYEAIPVNSPNTIGGKWTNWYHNGWSGPLPTVWRRDHVSVSDGKMKIRSSRPAGDSVTVSNQKLAVTNLGCATSTQQVQYPVYIEANVKIMKSVLASDVWLLSSDDTQEIDICEAYGSDRWTNDYFSNKRLHLSHHVFIREPFTDWQPSDAGSFYTDNTTIWSDGYHRIGVFWRDPWHLEYYVDGMLVRTRSGKDQIDPVFHTNAVNPGDQTTDTRTGLSKPMDIIINTEDQTWRALQGLTPTDAELVNTDDNTFDVDWVRVYKPVSGEVGPVTGVAIEPNDVSTFVGDVFSLKANIEPQNANDLSVVWETDNPSVATVTGEGVVTTHAEGVALIKVTTNENSLSATAMVTVSGEIIAASVDLNEDSTYLNTTYQAGGELMVSADFHAGSGHTVVDGGSGGVKFWLREIRPGWSVANDYVVSDPSTIGKESGTASATISLADVPTSAEIPAGNWYFLYVTFYNSNGDFLDQGIFPITIGSVTPTDAPMGTRRLDIYPNPSTSMLTIKQGDRLKNATLQVFSSTGKEVFVADPITRSTTVQLNIAHLPPGFYLIKWVSDAVYTASFIKQ